MELLSGRILLLVLVAATCGSAAADTPRVLWESRPVRAPAVSPTLSGDTLWVIGTDRRMLSMDARSGERHWRRTLPGLVVVAAVPAGELVLVGYGDPEPALVALRRRDGKPAWTQQAESSPVAILVSAGLASVACANGQLHTFDLADGALRWSQELGRRIAGAALSGRSLCVLARQDSLWLFDFMTGAPRGSVARSETAASPPVFAGSGVVAVGYQGGLVLADSASGTTVAVAAGPAPQIAPPSVSGDRLLTVATGGEVTCYRLPDLRPEWTRETGETVSAGAVAWNEGWVIVTEKGRVMGLSLDRGQIGWSLQFQIAFSTRPTVNASLLALIDNRGRVVVHAVDGAP